MPATALIYVGIGGAAGAMLRYIISSNFEHHDAQFPWGTFIANISGALLIGVLYVLIIEKPIFYAPLPEALRQTLITGFLGGLTTYSSFSLEGIQLLSNGHYHTAIVYILSTMIVCLLLTFTGMSIARLAA